MLRYIANEADNVSLGMAGIDMMGTGKPGNPNPAPHNRVIHKAGPKPLGVPLVSLTWWTPGLFMAIFWENIVDAGYRRNDQIRIVNTGELLWEGPLYEVQFIDTVGENSIPPYERGKAALISCTMSTAPYPNDQTFIQPGESPVDDPPRIEFGEFTDPTWNGTDRQVKTIFHPDVSVWNRILLLTEDLSLTGTGSYIKAWTPSDSHGDPYEPLDTSHFGYPSINLLHYALQNWITPLLGHTLTGPFDQIETIKHKIIAYRG